MEDLHKVAAFLKKAYQADIIMLGHSFGGDLMYRYMITKGNNFIIEKAISFLYYPDGNLKELTEQCFTSNGQVENTYIDQFEQYHNRINADGFSLLHNEFFEHFFILPGVQLQKNNPVKLTRTGTGVNYKINYNYTYTNKNLSLTKIGEAVNTNGSGAGQKFQTISNFSYY